MRSMIGSIWHVSWLTCLLCTISLVDVSAADAPDEAAVLIDDAISSYRSAMESEQRDRRLAGFGRAERLFAAAIERGASNAELYTNLGNAALQAERLGPAVLAYRRALLLDPGLERARQNLRHTRALLPDWVPTPPEAGLLDSFFLWHSSTPRAARAELAALCFALAGLLLAASIFWRSSTPRYLAIPAGIAWLALLLSLFFDPARNAGREGVVIVRDTLGRAADSINAPSRFGEALPGGSEIRILEDRGDWLQVELHNGRNAWLASSAVERVALTEEER